MIKLFTALLCFICLTSFYKQPPASDYDVEAFYKGLTPTEGTKILTANDDLEDIKLLLVPVDIDKGNYVLKVSRKGSNIYKVDGKNIYIQTKYCHEYSYSQEIILKVDGSYGYTKGKIIF
jgi:hypothetical protein